MAQVTGPAREHLPGRNRPLAIALYGEFGTENLGNDGSLAAAIRLVRTRLPDVDLTAVCVHPDAVRAQHGIDAVAMHPPGPPGGLPRVVVRALRVLLTLADPWWCRRILKGSDALIVTGTGIVEDSAAMKAWHAPWALFAAVLGARLRGVTVAFLNVGASPATTRTKRFLFGAALRMAAYRSYRDDFSLAAARSLGVRDRDDAIHPDIGFSLPVPAAEGDGKRDGHLVEVGVGVMSYHGDDPDPAARRRAHRRYADEVTAFTEEQVRAGRRPRMLIGESTDLAVAHAIAAEVEARCALAAGTIRVEEVGDLDGVMREMREVDALVATRFHNVVCALMVATPLVVINYAPKNRALMRAVGLEEYSVDIDDVDSEFLSSRMAELLANNEGVRDQIASRVGDYPRRITEQIDDLVDQLDRLARRRMARRRRKRLIG